MRKEIIEYNNQRILTTTQLAEAYNTDEKRISENFSRNKDRYKHGKHFIQLEGETLKIFKRTYPQIAEQSKRAPLMYLWTQKGALMHAKSLNTDEAWESYEKLVDYYFQKNDLSQPSYTIEDPIARAERWIQEQKEKMMLQQRISEYEPKVEYVDKILQCTNTVTITQIAKDYGLTGNKLNQILHEEGVQYKLNGQWLLYRKFQDKGYTKSKTIEFRRTDGTTGATMNTYWTQKGRLFIHELLKKRGIVPLIDR